MEMKEIMADIRQAIPLKIESCFDLTGKRAGLIIVDEVNGFVTIGKGALAPPAPDLVIDSMVWWTDLIARLFVTRGLPILVLHERHKPGVLEPPYPPHCEEGSGEDELPDRLKWLYQERTASFIYKNCINGFIGATRPDGSNAVARWINDNRIEHVVVVGICTDICVMQFVQALLSARNLVFPDGSRMMPSLKEVIVWIGACTTYDLPVEVAVTIPGLSEYDAHPRKLTQYLGLYFMARSGAILTDSIIV